MNLVAVSLDILRINNYEIVVGAKVGMQQRACREGAEQDVCPPSCHTPGCYQYTHAGANSRSSHGGVDSLATDCMSFGCYRKQRVIFIQ